MNGFIIFTCLIIIAIIGAKLFQERHNRQRIVKQEVQKWQSEFSEQQTAQLKAQLSSLNELIADKQEEIEQIEKYKIKIKDSVDNDISSYKQLQLKIAQEQIDEEAQKKLEACQRNIAAAAEEYAISTEEMSKNLTKLQEDLADMQKKHDAINEEILRQREIEQKNDFYRVCLKEESISDINILSQVKQNLKKPEIIDKMIYDNYIAKPVLEMEKRVLQNTTYSGIYKITCIPTKEIYIGKSTDIKSRWQQHCKSAFNCGTIASSLLHVKMKDYGIQNFTFELLEKVPKEKLTEREKFYINFYKTKEVGMNERVG